MTMHIGLIGGIGPGATDYYYRRLISTFAERNSALDLTIVHADAPTLLRNLASNDVAAQTSIYARLTARLVSAGAECVAVTSIAGHFCIDAFKAISAASPYRYAFRSEPSYRERAASSGSAFWELAP